MSQQKTSQIKALDAAVRNLQQKHDEVKIHAAAPEWSNNSLVRQNNKGRRNKKEGTDINVNKSSIPHAQIMH